MISSRFQHYNNCPRCPIVGAEDISGDEYCTLSSLRFNIRFARNLCGNRIALPVDRSALERWLKRAQIDRAHVGHLPANLGPGIMVTLPNGCGMPVIDGNHRAAKAASENRPFYVFVLSEAETLELLRMSIGKAAANHYWKRLIDSQPHPDDQLEDEEE